MAQTREEIAQNLAERLCWQAARREDSRIARRLYRKQVVDRIYRLDEGALLDDFFCFLNELGSSTCWTMSRARWSSGRWSRSSSMSCSIASRPCWGSRA
jgi:hypothetical protein